MGKKNGKKKTGSGKKPCQPQKARAAEPAQAEAAASPLIDSQSLALALFKRTLRFNENLSYVLDLHRVKLLQDLLGVIGAASLHSALLLLAYRHNDAEAIHVLLSAGHFDEKEFSVFHCMRFLARPFYFPLEPSDAEKDLTARRVYIKLKLAYSKLLKQMVYVDLFDVIQSRYFKIQYLQDPYVANMLFSAFEEQGKENDLAYHRQTLLPHACSMGFQVIINFCVTSHVLPDIDNIPLIDAHAPLAYYALSSRINKIETRAHLLANWSPDLEMSDVCALELLALCCLLGELDDIKQQLHERLSGKDISSIALGVLNGDLILVLLEHDPEVRSHLSLQHLQAMLVKMQSAPLLSWVLTKHTEGFVGFECLKQCISECNHPNAMNGLNEAYFFKHWANFFEQGLEHLTEINNKNMDFLLALFIVEDRVGALIQLSEKFSFLFPLQLAGTFPDASSLKNFDFQNLTPLKAALVNHSPTVIVWMYQYMIQNQLEINPIEIGAHASDLLVCLLNAVESSQYLISCCLEMFQNLYCDTLTLKKLLDLCLNQRPVNIELLQKVMPLASPYFNDTFFNFYSDDGFSCEQLEHLSAAFECLDVVLRQRGTAIEACAASRDSMQQTLYLAGLKQDPLRDLSKFDEQVVRDKTLADLCPSLMIGSDEEKGKVQDLMMRRIWILYKENRRGLNKELTDVWEYREIDSDGSEKFTHCSVIGFLCYYNMSEVLVLALVLCPDLDLSEKHQLSNYLKPFSALCFKGNLTLAKRFMEYISSRGRASLHLSLFGGALSAVYIATQYGMSVAGQQIKQEFRETPFSEYAFFSNAAKLQVLGYIDQRFKDEPKELSVWVERFKLCTIESMLSVAISLQDSTLVLVALKYEFKGMVPKDQREALIKLLFLSPHVGLLETLNLGKADILKTRDYSELGYLNKVDGFSVCLSQCEIAFSSGLYKLAKDYCVFLTKLVGIVDVSAYQLETVLHLLNRLQLLSKSDSDKDVAKLNCYQVMMLERSPFFAIKPDQALIAFMEYSLTLIDKKYLDKVIKIKRWLARFSEPVFLKTFLGISLQCFMADLSFQRYRAAAGSLQAGLSLPAELRVIDLCHLLASADFLAGIHKTLVDAVACRMQSHPGEINGDLVSVSPLQLLIGMRQEFLVRILLNQDAVFLRHQCDQAPFLTQLCRQQFPRNVLQAFCEKVPPSMPLAEVLTLGALKGVSPLYVFYQATKRADAADFLLDHIAQLKDCSDIAVLELWGLVVEWVCHPDFSRQKARLVSLERELFEIIATAEIQVITALRQLSSERPSILMCFRMNKSEILAHIDACHVDWLLNVAASQANIPLMDAVCRFVLKAGLLFDVTLTHAWVDSSDASTVLNKLHRDLLSESQKINVILPLLRALLPVMDVQVLAVKSELIEIVTELLSYDASVMDIVSAAKFSREAIQGLAKVAYEKEHPDLVHIVNHYTEVFPKDYDILSVHEKMLGVLLQKITAIQNHSLLTVLLQKVNKLAPQALIDVLDPLDEIALLMIKSQKPFKGESLVLLEVACSCREKKRPSLKAYLQSLLDTHKNELSTGLKTLHATVVSVSAESVSLDECERALKTLDDVIMKLSSLTKKTTGVERHFRQAAYRLEFEQIDVLQVFCQEKKAIILVCQEGLIQAQAEQALLAEQARVEEQKAAEKQAELERKRQEEQRQRDQARALRKLQEQRQAEEQERQRVLAEQARAAAAAEALEKEKNFYEMHEQALTRALQDGAQNATQNPYGFHAVPAAVVRVAVVARANLVQEERGLRVVCTREKGMFIESASALYVTDLRIQAGRCCVYFNGSGQWTILQCGQVFQGLGLVQPLSTGSLRLMHAEKVAVELPFVVGFDARPPSLGASV